MSGAQADARRPLRLLMVTPRYLPEIGGVERHVQAVARRLVDAGNAVTVLTTDRSGALSVRDEVEGIEVRRVRAWPGHGDVHVAPAIPSEIAREQWDLVHVQSYHTFVAPLAMLAAIRSGLPYVVTFHGGGHSSRLRKLVRPVQRRAMRPLFARARRLIAVAPFEIDAYSRELGLPRERFSLIPNGAELESQGAPEPPATNSRTIASIGRLERYKGHQRVIAALPHVLEQEPSARLWIAGAGRYEPQLHRLAKRLGVSARVTIRVVAGSEMGRELGQVGVVVLLSEFETHPLAALEAVALNRQLVVARTPGLAELEHQGWARGVPLHADPRDVAHQIVAAMREPLEPPTVRPFTWDDCAARLEELYRSIVSVG